MQAASLGKDELTEVIAEAQRLIEQRRLLTVHVEWGGADGPQARPP